MKDQLLTSKLDTNKLIYGKELMLIIFAAFLLVAAIPTVTIKSDVATAQINEPPTETLNTATAKLHEDQTTALLTITELPLK